MYRFRLRRVPHVRIPRPAIREVAADGTAIWPEEESQLLNTHVAGCEECREKLALMNAVQRVGDLGQ